MTFGFSFSVLLAPNPTLNLLRVLESSEGAQGYPTRPVPRAWSPAPSPASHTHLQGLGVHHTPVDPKDPLLRTLWPRQHPSSVAQGPRVLPLLQQMGQAWGGGCPKLHLHFADRTLKHRRCTCGWSWVNVEPPEKMARAGQPLSSAMGPTQMSLSSVRVAAAGNSVRCTQSPKSPQPLRAAYGAGRGPCVRHHWPSPSQQ